MTYFAYVSPVCEKEAKRHGQIAEIEKLARYIELGQAIDNLDHHGRFRKKSLGKSYRLIIGEVHDQSDCLLVFWRVLPKSSKEYAGFCESYESFDQDFTIFTDAIDLEQVLAEKRQSPDIPQLKNLDEEERAYLYWPASQQDNGWLVLESSEWVQRMSRDTGEFRSYLSSLHGLLYELIEKPPTGEEIHDDKVSLLFRCLPEERIIFLVAPVKRDNRADLEQLRTQYRRELCDAVDAESLLRRSRRTYPGLIVYDSDLWIHRIQEANEKANLALSKEEARILRHRQEGYPLFINGRPGSGKSTVLQYLFAEHLQQFLNNATALGCPLYLTYNEDLLDIAQENVLQILTCNAHKLLSGDPTPSPEKVEQAIRRCFVDFRDYLSSLLPQNRRFPQEKYIGFPDFRLHFDERFSKHPDKQVRAITAELAWHVIRTYIKGMSSEQEGDFDIDHYRELPNTSKSVTNSTYGTVYNVVWQGWYKKFCDEDGFWDDQDLARRVLTLVSDSSEQLELAKHPAIFCDEAQDFTKNELRLIYRLSLFSRRNLTPDVLRRIPFAFAGDPFQTLNPTGFDWESTRTVFYKTLIDQLDTAQKPTLELNYQELSFNYRSTRAIVQLCNFIHLVRGVVFGKRGLHPQRTYFDEAANMPVYFDIASPVLQSKLRGQQEIVIIVPCQEGEELEYIRNDVFLSAIALNSDKTQIARNVLSPMRAKGQEFSRVVIYKFGEVCSSEYTSLLELMDPHTQERHLSPEQTIPAEYFINRLYVAASRAQKRLFIADTNKGLQSFWRFFELGDPDAFVQNYRDNVQQPKSSDDFSWRVEDLVKIQPGDQSSWEQDHDDPADLAEEFFRSGQRSKDTYKLRLAIQNFQAAGKDDKKRECEGWLLEYEGQFEKAGACFAEIGNLDRARKLYWKAGAFTRILEFGEENSLEHAASAFMLSRENEPNGNILDFLNALYNAFNDGLIQPDETWGKVISAVLAQIVDKKPEADLHVYEWANLNRIIGDFEQSGIYAKSEDRILEQIRLRATPYPGKIELLQRPGVEPALIAKYYLERPRVPLNDIQVEIIFQALLKMRKYDELEELLANYPSLKRLSSLLVSCIQAEQEQRLSPLVQRIFVFMCEQNMWDTALDFAGKVVLPLEEDARQTIRRHDWGRLLDELFIKALSVSATLPKADIPTKNSISKYLRTQLLDDARPLHTRVTVAQAGSALERANMILDCLEFYESVYSLKSWPASEAEIQLARERWLVCKKRQIEIQKEAPKKQRIKGEIGEKQREWRVAPLSELPEFPAASLTDKPIVVTLANPGFPVANTISIDVQKMNCELRFGPQCFAVLAHEGQNLAG